MLHFFGTPCRVPQKNCALCAPLKVHLLLSIYCFHFFLSFFVIVQFQFFIVSKFFRNHLDFIIFERHIYMMWHWHVMMVDVVMSWGLSILIPDILKRVNFEDLSILIWNCQNLGCWNPQIKIIFLRIWASYILKFQDWGSWILNF